jgi:hypothetical protein
MPWEGFVISINGAKGRIEYKVAEKAYINSGGISNEEGAVATKEIIVHPLFAAPYAVEIEEGVGSHGGGDAVMLRDIFGTNPPEDRFKRAAGLEAGLASIMTGICANKAIAGGQPQRVILPWGTCENYDEPIFATGENSGEARFSRKREARQGEKNCANQVFGGSP